MSCLARLLVLISFAHQIFVCLAFTANLRAPTWPRSSKITTSHHSFRSDQLARTRTISGSLKLQSPDTVTKRDAAFRGEHHDRQWSLNIENFRGKWSGPTYWYIRNNERLDLATPANEIAGSCYEVSFPDSETGQWKGSGLRFTNGTKILPLSRATYNSNSLCFQFPGSGGNGGVGGQGARDLSSSINATGKYPHEINFFNQRTRSMIIVVFNLRQLATGSQVFLESVAATPFRCQYGCSIGDRKQLESVGTLLRSLKGWQGERLSFGPHVPLDERRRPSGEFDPRPFASASVSAVLPDNLVLGVPEVVPQGQPFDLVFGCLQTDSLFKQITIGFDEHASLVRWTLDEFRPAGAA